MEGKISLIISWKKKNISHSIIGVIFEEDADTLYHILQQSRIKVELLEDESVKECFESASSIGNARIMQDIIVFFADHPKRIEFIAHAFKNSHESLEPLLQRCLDTGLWFSLSIGLTCSKSGQYKRLRDDRLAKWNSKTVNKKGKCRLHPNIDMLLRLYTYEFQ